MKRFPYARNITGMSASEFNQALEDWQAGRLRMLIAHPASAGHGIDGLQARGRVLVWFGLNWSLELYLQFNARLHRQGQSAPVVCHRILTRDTLDDAVRLSLEYKTQTQEDLRRAVSEYRRRKERTATVVDFMEIAA
jgi:SNF2 family DNA or RNA helicase